MGFIQKSAFRMMVITTLGLLLGYLNKGILFVLILNSEEIGLLNLLVSVGLLFSQLANLGAVNVISKFAPFFKDNQEQRQSFLSLNVFLVTVGIIIFTLITLLLNNQITFFYGEKSALFVKYFYWILPIGIANVFFLIFEAHLRSRYNNVLAVFLNDFIVRILVTLSLILYAANLINFHYLLVINCLLYFIPAFILFFYLLKTKELSFNNNRLKISRKFKKVIFNFSLFIYSNSIVGLFVLTMDALMITYFLGLKATGIYTTITFLTNAVQIPYRALFRIASPLVPQYWKEKNMVKMNELYKQVSSISLIIALFLFLLIWVNRIELFSFLPKEYNEGIYVFLFLMIGRAIDMYSGLNTVIFITSKKFKYEMIFTVILPFLVFFLNCWLIPSLGVIGAAISTSFALIVYNVGRMLFILFAYKLHPFEKKQIYVTLLFISLLGLFYFLPNFGVNKYLSLVINSTLALVLFMGIIIKLKWNKDLNEYIKNTYATFFKKGLKA